MASNDKRATRLGMLGAVALILLGALTARLWFVQTVEAEQLQSRVDQRALRTEQLSPQRGQIFDIEGRLLATSIPHLNVVVSWDGIRGDLQRATLFQRISGWIGVSVDELEGRYDSGRYSRIRPMPLADDVPENIAIALMERIDDFPGLAIERGFSRAYPYAPVASHVIGYMGAITAEDQQYYKDRGYDTSNRGDRVGRAGIELAYEEQLRGTPGTVTVEVDTHGRVIREVARVEPIDGYDIQLSIDMNVQQYAESLLRTRLVIHRKFTTPNCCRTKPDGTKTQYLPGAGGSVAYPAPAGSMVVLDQLNGRVLAMASYPTFDNRWFEQSLSSEKFNELFRHPLLDRAGNQVYTADGKARLDPDKSSLTNRAIQGQYNLGSTFKPFVAYAAVMTGLISPYTEIYDAGTYKAESIEDERCGLVKCVWRNALCGTSGKPCEYGPITMKQSLAQSSDVYYYRLGEKFFLQSGPERDTLQQWVNQFGFGMRTGIDLPSEFAGRLPSNEMKANLLERGVLHPDEQPNLLLGDIINLSIGQGLLAATPIQLAVAYATIANGGHVVTPRVAIAIFPPHTPQSATPGFVDFQQVQPVAWLDEPGRQITIPQELRDVIVQGLRDNIKGVRHFGRSTTAGKLFDRYPSDHIRVAGKTGTAQGANSYPFNDSSVFAAFSLENEPGRAYTVVAYLEKAGFGSRAAAPAVKCMFMALSDPARLPTVRLAEPLDVTSSLAAQPAPWIADLGCMAGSDSDNITPTTLGSASAVD